jgi:hypothetical protein
LFDWDVDDLLKMCPPNSNNMLLIWTEHKILQLLLISYHNLGFLKFIHSNLKLQTFETKKIDIQICIKRSPLRGKKWSYKTGDLLKEVQFI